MIHTTAKQPINEQSSDKNATRQFHLSVPEAQHAGLHNRIKFLNRTFLSLAFCAAIGVGGMTMAQHTGNGHVKVTKRSQRNVIEKVDGKPASVTVEEVTFEPGQTDSPHRHTGAVFGYVLEGAYEHALDEDGGADSIFYGTQMRAVSNAKVKRELNFHPRPLEWIAGRPVDHYSQQAEGGAS